MCLFKDAVESIAACGLELVAMTPSLCRHIDASNRRVARDIFGITWPVSISTGRLTQRNNPSVILSAQVYTGLMNTLLEWSPGVKHHLAKY